MLQATLADWLSIRLWRNPNVFTEVPSQFLSLPVITISSGTEKLVGNKYLFDWVELPNKNFVGYIEDPIEGLKFYIWREV
jgi:hypothetical protein